MSKRPVSVSELREAFLHYFETKNHSRLKSSSLIPLDDPTLLFANAGMNQFKNFFTGKETPGNPRATTCQKCVRAGGKHNDLESVGKTKRHHTFFEMLGNFSFGDYFKKEAIEFAWEFLTEVVELPKDKLWISVFREDDEAYDLWVNHMGLPADRVVRMDEEDNFWAMGDTGPCGPCSEIYIDRGEAFGAADETIFDGGERFLEIWNLVFMQFERLESGTVAELPKPSVDTGMGLERLASVVQGVENNYLIDSMRNILDGFSKLVGKKFGENEEDDIALKVLTDHIRAVTFLITDGVQPSNEGRGYVLRRILRRAIRFGKNLGMNEAFFYKGVKLVLDEMGQAYPELALNYASVQKIVQIEEEKFLETLDSGLKLLNAELKNLKPGETLDGAVAFQLYDTFGFPVDLTQMILEERSYKLDQVGFSRALGEQRERSRSSWKGGSSDNSKDIYLALSNKNLESRFVGYEKLESKSKILAIISDSKEVEEVQEGAEAEIMLEETPFYAESGGQVGDQGELVCGESLFQVTDCVKPLGSFHLLRGKVVKGVFKVGSEVAAKVEESIRRRTRIHHTMTHVLHATLQEVLGDHIKQAGSLVTADYLRFDFNHFQAVSKDELREIEAICNRRIRENPDLRLSEESMDDAIASGAKAFFEDKYGDQVRVLRIGAFSIELCGGTHAESLAEAGLFKITSESSVASGVRRIVAVTGEAAYEFIREEEALIDELAEKLKTPRMELSTRVDKLLREQKDLQKKLSQKSTTPQTKASELVTQIEKYKVLVDLAAVESPKDLRPLADDYKNQLKDHAVILLGFRGEDKATVVVSVSKDVAEAFNTKDLVSRLGEKLGGKGGGRPDFAQVGGPAGEFLSRENLINLAKEHIESLQS